MKRIIILIPVLFALGWFMKSRFSASIPSTLSIASTLPQPSNPPAESPPASGIVSTATNVDVLPSAQASSSPEPGNAAALPSYPQMSLLDVLEPNNVFHDALLGVSATYPDGWLVRKAIRWGQNNSENTVFFSPPEGSSAIPSMYYQMYPNGTPAVGNPETILREMAEQKEASRLQGGAIDYKNDPDSLVFREIDGHPSLSYFATFTRGDQVQSEYFTRILGEKGYVMFFVRGPAKDVQTLIPSVYQMSGTVKPP